MGYGYKRKNFFDCEFPAKFRNLLNDLVCEEVVLGLKTGEELCGRILSVKDDYVIFEVNGCVYFIEMCCICYVEIADICDLVGDIFGCED